MPTCFSALMCHAPIVLPEVGGTEARKCRHTTRAMREVAERVVASGPDRLVLLSPHSPRRKGSWSIWPGPRHRGDLSRFRAPRIRVDLPDAPEVNQHLNLPGIADEPLDHGAMVPLAFLWEAGWRGPTAILALPWDEQGAEEMGRALAALPGRTAILASGDMSHRLQPGAPSGFHPQARRFDAAFVNLLRRRDWNALAQVPYRDIAAEDVVTTTRAAIAAVPTATHDEVLCYEGPWGVGYTEAVFFDPEPPLYVIARRAVRARLIGATQDPSSGGPSQGVFVTLRKNGELRGCIGHTEPLHEHLHTELREVAVAAALRDPRFPPVHLEDLRDLTFEVSLLTPPVPVTEPLNAKRDGIIVASGRRKGLLLPNIDGVDTPEHQEAIARQKAGIGPNEPIVRSTFQIEKISQPELT